jgi:hypothetical protein
LPLWAKSLWKLMQTPGSNHLMASFYVQAINTVRQVRDFGSSLVRRG